MVAEKPNQDPLSKLYAEWVSAAMKMSVAGLDATLKIAEAASQTAMTSRAKAKSEIVDVAHPPLSELAKTDAPVADDLKRITGVGPKLAQMLLRKGITSFSQLALLDDAAIDRLDTDLNLNGRIHRDEWVEQAKKLSQNTGA